MKKSKACELKITYSSIELLQFINQSKEMISVEKKKMKNESWEDKRSIDGPKVGWFHWFIPISQSSSYLKGTIFKTFTTIIAILVHSQLPVIQYYWFSFTFRNKRRHLLFFLFTFATTIMFHLVIYYYS